MDEGKLHSAQPTQNSDSWTLQEHELETAKTIIAETLRNKFVPQLPQKKILMEVNKKTLFLFEMQTMFDMLSLVCIAMFK